MPADILARSVRLIELFQGLTPLQVTEIARRAERTIYRAGDSIITAGAEADAAVLIVSGEARRTHGPDLTAIEPVPAGALLCEMAMLIDTAYSSTVIAVTTVRALRITRSEMLAQMAADPALAEHFVSRIAARLNDLAEEMRGIERGLGAGAACGPQAELPMPASAFPTLH